MALMLVLAACGQPPADAPAPPPPAAPAATADTASVQEYETVGVVANVLANKKFVVIRHAAIPGYMDAMSMPFAVDDSALLDGIAPQDSVRFRFAASPGRVVLRTLEKIE